MKLDTDEDANINVVDADTIAPDGVHEGNSGRMEHIGAPGNMLIVREALFEASICLFSAFFLPANVRCKGAKFGRRLVNQSGSCSLGAALFSDSMRALSGFRVASLSAVVVVLVWVFMTTSDGGIARDVEVISVSCITVVISSAVSSSSSPAPVPIFE